MKSSRKAVDAYLAARTSEEGDCLLWKLAVNGEGIPVASIDGVRSRPVRRWVWEALHGPAGTMRVIASCNNPSCVAPQHCQAVSPGDMNRAIARRGGFSTPAFRRAAQIKGRSTSSLTLSDVRKIRRRRYVDGHTLTAIQADYPRASLTILSRICRGESWPDPADPWVGLARVESRA